MQLLLRRAAFIGACLLGILLSGCAGMSAPYNSGSLERNKEPEVLTLTPDLLLNMKTQADAAANAPATLPSSDRSTYRYRIQPNDILKISVPSVVIFNSPGDARIVNGNTDDGFTVYDDGTVYLPFGGYVPVAGATPAEAQARVIKALSTYLKTGQVVVAVADFRSQRVMVTGQVQKPGYQPITDVPLTLIAAISASGGILQLRGQQDPRAITTAAAQIQTSTAEYPDLKHVLLKRGDVQYVVDVEKMLKTGDVREDFILQDGDVVIVPPLKHDVLFVLGEVIRPALVEVSHGDANLAKVLVAAGGINQLSANARRIYIIRGDFEDPKIYQLDSRHPDALLLAQKFELQGNDIVYVAEAPIGRWNRALSQILPTLQGLLSTAVIVNTVDNLGGN
ncbi:polysaccharide biosynthesis/export family protein [Solimonas soli]|uniref:polysaccharide biosynthesis/export family protein n=1 Tax=Solimonas soli TaxID=413479 RepID=UPI0004AD0A1F|nr:polysaccharide biosynthesis/export family protein [Solimonas soli]